MQGTQLYIPPLSRVNKILMISVGGLFILQSILQSTAGVNLLNFFGLSASYLSKGHIYTLITYPFFQNGLMSTVFDCLIIWFIGSDLENRWGEKNYLFFLLSSVLVAGVFYIFISFAFANPFAPLVGVTGMSYSLLLASSILFPDRAMLFMMIFPIKSRYFCYLLIGILFFTGIFSGSQSSWGHLAAMMGGFGYMLYMTKKSQGEDLNLGKYFKKKRKNNLYLIKNKEDEKDPKYWQ